MVGFTEEQKQFVAKKNTSPAAVLGALIAAHALAIVVGAGYTIGKEIGEWICR